MNEQNGWEKPKLIVLGRGTPEEHVLNNCKHEAPWFNGPAIRGCRTANDDAYCQSYTLS